ncbi:MAG TPA: hypothetical protein VGJ60_12895 [Chloroflexota bacterium]|jgi:hypothetical protein
MRTISPSGRVRMDGRDLARHHVRDAMYAKTVQTDQQALLAAGVEDPTLGYYSPTDAVNGQTLAQMVSDQLLAIVTGRSPLSDLDTLLKDWAAQGGNLIRTEYQQLLQNSGKSQVLGRGSDAWKLRCDIGRQPPSSTRCTRT